MWKDGTYKKQRMSDIMTQYEIMGVKKKTHNTFVVETKGGLVLKILLRWKNGNGIAFPAFQIK